MNETTSGSSTGSDSDRFTRGTYTYDDRKPGTGVVRERTLPSTHDDADPDREPPLDRAVGSARVPAQAIGQLSPERHGAHTMPGLFTRIAQRLLALAASLWHNWNTGQPGRHLITYDH
jgi:hypothetical protein